MAKTKKAKLSFKARVLTFFDHIKQIKIDRNNRKLFVEEMEHEIANPNSTFNKFKLNMDADYKEISCFINVPENYQLSGNDAMIYGRLRDESMNINRYLAHELNWGEYFVAPDFYYVEDEEDTSDSISCTYLAVWTYTPVLKAVKNFKWEIAAFTGINASIIAGIICLIVLL